MRGDVVPPRGASAVGQVAQELIPAVRGNVIDGAAIAGRVLAEVRTEVENACHCGDRKPHAEEIGEAPEPVPYRIRS